MKVKKISVFKGLQENIDFADLREEYADSMSNLDVDEPYGQLTFRDGYLKKYSDSFTNILSAFEYKFPTPDDVVLLINDNGTLELYNDGVKGTNLTLPTGSTLESGFKNQMFGYKDSILITTGNGATNHILWYGYIDRRSSQNDGLFGNVEQFNSGTPGYDLLRAQLICEEGGFSNVSDAIYLGGYYYISFEDDFYTRYIEKRDSSFRVLERFICSEEYDKSGTALPVDGYRVNICTDETYIYVLFNTSTSQMYCEKRNPNGWVLEGRYDCGATTGVPGGICTDGTHVYAVRRGSNDTLFKITASDMTIADSESAGVTNILDICCDQTASTGYIYTIKTATIEKRLKSDLSVDSSDSSYTGFQKCYYRDSSDFIYVSSITGSGHIYNYDASDLSMDNDYANIVDPIAFIEIDGTTVRGISSHYGTVESIESTDTYYPSFLGLHLRSISAGGNLASDATFFYKFSIVDINDQEYTLSEKLVVPMPYAGISNLVLTANINTDSLDHLYRVKSINIYRAYASTYDADIPETNYIFIKNIDINDLDWVSEKAAHEIYYYEYEDNLSQENIGSVTYFENSGISDETKPRYVNPKFMTWLDDQLHVANFYYDGDTYKNQIIRSPINQPANIAFYDYYDFGSDGYEIKGITNAFGRTVVFKQFKVGVFYNGTLEHEDDYGISSERGYTKVGDDIFFANPKGIFYLRGHEKLRISEPIEVSWAGLSDYTDNILFVFEDRDRLIISVPGEYSFVYNLRYKTWVKYSSAFTFKSFFKNSSSEYIGFGDPLTGGSEYFWKISSGLDGRETNGTGGTGITVAYDSGLLRMEATTGYNVTLQQIDYRSLFTSSILSPITMSIYRYHGTGRSAIRTGVLSQPSGSYITTKTSYLDGAWGESFSWHLAGIASTFKFSEICFVYDDLGFIGQ